MALIVSPFLSFSNLSRSCLGRHEQEELGIRPLLLFSFHDLNPFLFSLGSEWLSDGKSSNLLNIRS